MPDKGKKVSDLNADEIAQEMQNIPARLEQLKALILSSGNFKPGDTLEERIKKLKAKRTGGIGEGGFLNQVAQGATAGLVGRPTKDANPNLRRAEVQVKGADGKYSVAQLGNLADEYQTLQERSKEIEDKLNSSDTLTADVKAKADAAATPVATDTGPNLGTSNDPTNFTGVFLSDKGIEDLARTGEFDIGPKEIAAMFPTTAVQAAQADQDPSTGPSLLDQLQPAQYKNSAFVKVGDGFATSDPTTMQRNQITDSDLPDWEKKVLLGELDKQAPKQLPMSDEEYQAARMKIFNEGSVGPERELKLQKLAQQYNAQKATKAGTASLRDVISKPYAMTASEVSSAAVQLFKAGYLNVPNYDPTKKLSEQMTITSAFDPNFQKAWSAWVGDSFKDRSKTMMDILQERQTNFMAQLQLYADQAKAAQDKANQHTIKVSDAAGIRQTADQFAEKQIGRKLTDVEHNQMVGYIQHLQSASQQALFDGATQVEDVDPDARILEAIKANNPVASDATDVANQYNNFKQLIGGPRAS